MNLREGTRRLALLLGLLGTIAGGYAACLFLLTLLPQRAAHKHFEQLSNSNVVQQERKTLQAPIDLSAGLVDRPNAQGYQYVKLPDGSSGKFPRNLSDAEIVAAIEKDFPNAKPWQIYQSLGKRINGPDFIPDAAPKTNGDSDFLSGAIPLSSEVNRGGIKTINWNDNYVVGSIETTDGQTIYPTPAPSSWLYILTVFLPILGFFVPWGAVRTIGWVGAGFSSEKG